MYFESCNKSDNAQKWYFLNKGGGYFLIVNVYLRYNLRCISKNEVDLNENNKDNDNQMWSTIFAGGLYLQNKEYSGYLTNNNGNPGVSSKPYKWNFESV